LKQDNSRGYAALRHGAALVERPDAGHLLLSGADRRNYLHGLLTNDITALAPGTGCYSAMLTAQGRMISDMRVLELGDAILLSVPRGLAPSLHAHFERFVFSEDVQVEDVTATRTELGVYGPGAADIVTKVTGAANPGTLPLFGSMSATLASADALIVHDDSIGIDGFGIVLQAPAAMAAREALRDAGAVLANDADVEAVRIESGRPRFGADMDADTIPLEAGIDARAISRTKGCYVGQEVIVRVIDRGHGRVARHLAGLILAADAASPIVGALLTSGDREVGRLTSVTWSPSLSRPIALGYVHRDFTGPGTHVTVQGAGDAVVTALPFVS
jgi:tRNA-modifying protein YgfZ